MEKYACRATGVDGSSIASYVLLSILVILNNFVIQSNAVIQTLCVILSVAKDLQISATRGLLCWSVRRSFATLRMTIQIQTIQVHHANSRAIGATPTAIMSATELG